MEKEWIFNQKNAQHPPVFLALKQTDDAGQPVIYLDMVDSMGETYPQGHLIKIVPIFCEKPLNNSEEYGVFICDGIDTEAATKLGFMIEATKTNSRRIRVCVP